MGVEKGVDEDGEGGEGVQGGVGAEGEEPGQLVGEPAQREAASCHHQDGPVAPGLSEQWGEAGFKLNQSWALVVILTFYIMKIGFICIISFSR